MKNFTLHESKLDNEEKWSATYQKFKNFSKIATYTSQKKNFFKWKSTLWNWNLVSPKMEFYRKQKIFQVIFVVWANKFEYVSCKIKLFDW